MKNNEQTIKDIREAMDNWSKALYRKDLEAMHHDYAETGYRLFDVQHTVESVEDVKNLWKECFPYFDKPQVEYKDMVIDAGEDMALVHFRSRINGMVQPIPKEMEDSWLRGTVVYKKINGSWKCIHEHISFPVNCETMQIAQAA
jgi:ketosteroid isomerase-like protein